MHVPLRSESARHKFRENRFAHRLRLCYDFSLCAPKPILFHSIQAILIAHPVPFAERMSRFEKEHQSA